MSDRIPKGVRTDAFVGAFVRRRVRSIDRLVTAVRRASTNADENGERRRRRRARYDCLSREASTRMDGWMDARMDGWMSMDGWRGTPLRWRRRDTDDDDDDDDADDDAGDEPTNDGEMNENATRGRNVPGGMKEGTAVRRARFSMDDARAPRAGERGN
jgi:hypothetical protein